MRTNYFITAFHKHYFLLSELLYNPGMRCLVCQLECLLVTLWPENYLANSVLLSESWHELWHIISIVLHISSIDIVPNTYFTYHWVVNIPVTNHQPRTRKQIFTVNSWFTYYVSKSRQLITVVEVHHSYYLELYCRQYSAMPRSWHTIALVPLYVMQSESYSSPLWRRCNIDPSLYRKFVGYR